MKGIVSMRAALSATLMSLATMGSASPDTTSLLSIGTGQSLVGLWAFDSCTDPESIEFQGHTLAAFSGNDGPSIVAQRIDPIPDSPWLFVRTDADDPAPLLMRRNGENILQAWPQREPEDTDGIALLHDALSSGSLAPETAPDAFNIETGVPCAGLPMPISLALGETFAVLKSLDTAVLACLQNGAACPRVLFDATDITSDGQLSVAEMARMMRASLVIATAMDDDSGSAHLMATGAASAAMAPVAAAALLHSFDYDRSGTLSFAELLGERLPHGVDMSSPSVVSVAGIVDLISNASRTAQTAGAFLLQ